MEVMNFSVDLDLKTIFAQISDGGQIQMVNIDLDKYQAFLDQNRLKQNKKSLVSYLTANPVAV
jgi:hypothetical protein